LSFYNDIGCGRWLGRFRHLLVQMSAIQLLLNGSGNGANLNRFHAKAGKISAGQAMNRFISPAGDAVKLLAQVDEIRLWVAYRLKFSIDGACEKDARFFYLSGDM